MPIKEIFLQRTPQNSTWFIFWPHTFIGENFANKKNHLYDVGLLESTICENHYADFLPEDFFSLL